MPADYDATYKSYAAQGGRVIALAQRTLPADTDAAAARALTREQAESRAQFAGFAVFQCPLKAESEPALRCGSIGVGWGASVRMPAITFTIMCKRYVCTQSVVAS